MRHNTPTHRTHHAFSLLELSIVLGIIALIAGAGMTMATGALKTADRITTQERLATIKIALDSYAKASGYLPCPFNRTLSPSNAGFGVEDRSGGNCNNAAAGVTAPPGLILANNTWFGGVPVRALGLPDSYAADAWGNKLTYAVSANHIGNPTVYPSTAGAITIKFGLRAASPSSYAASSQRMSLSFTSAAAGVAGTRLIMPTTGSIINGTLVHVNGTVHKGSYIVANRTATVIELTGNTSTTTDTGNVEWLEPGASATYAVVSHGPDGRGAFPLSAAVIPAIKQCNDGVTATTTSPAPCPLGTNTSCIDIENCNDSVDAIFYDTTYNDNAIAAQYFDDFIVWGSNALVRTPVSTSLYTACPTGTCEAWCATCSTNYPGASLSAPPTTITAGTAVLCKKVITTASTTCSASCFWAGTTAAGYQKCP